MSENKNRLHPLQTVTEVWRSTYTNLYDVYFLESGTAKRLDGWMDGESVVPWMCFRAEAIKIGDTTLEGEYSETLRRTLVTGFTPVKEVTITFRENQGYAVLRELKKRFDMSFDRTTGRMIAGGPAAAKMDIAVVLESPGSATSPYVAAAVIYLTGALIQNIPAPDLSWKDSSAVVYETRFWIDDISYEAPGFAGGIDTAPQSPEVLQSTFKTSEALDLTSIQWYKDIVSKQAAESTSSIPSVTTERPSNSNSSNTRTPTTLRPDLIA